MCAGKKNIAVELVNVNHIRILVGMELVSVLIIFVGLVIAVLQDEPVRVATEKCVFEGLDLVQDWRLITDAQALGVDYFGRLRGSNNSLLFVHYYL